MPITKITNRNKYLGQFQRGELETALEHALDIRKFEIELYWKRAAYVWAFIAAARQLPGAVHGLSTLAPLEVPRISGAR